MEQENFKGPVWSVKDLLQDAVNEINQFRFLGDVDIVREETKKYNFKTLEEYTGVNRETFEANFPGVCEKFNKLIAELKSGNFDDQRLKEILDEAWAITHP